MLAQPQKVEAQHEAFSRLSGRHTLSGASYKLIRPSAYLILRKSPVFISHKLHYVPIERFA